MINVKLNFVLAVFERILQRANECIMMEKLQAFVQTNDVRFIYL